MTWSLFAASSTPADLKPSPSTLSPLKQTTKQVAEVVATRGCIKSITLDQGSKVHFVLNEAGKFSGQFYFEGPISIEMNPEKAANCDITNNVARVPINE